MEKFALDRREKGRDGRGKRKKGGVGHVEKVGSVELGVFGAQGAQLLAQNSRRCVEKELGAS